jgi:glyoxylase-like metal-dependent hydrolase (beta-lactamase superfamily II)
MAQTRIVTLDLNFQGRKQAIASYLVRRGDAVILIESGPGSTRPALEAGLAQEGLASSDVTHLLLTHIHLDHAGAAGWLARQGAEVYVHPVGAPHMLNPERLLASATRIYGDRMDSLWGEFLPVPEEKLHVAQDGQPLVFGDLEFLPLSTPGHAEHHHAYLFEDICFTGDVGGVRIPGYQYLRVPMVPPELHLERWRESIERLRVQKFSRIAPTHFGIYEDPEWQLREVEKGLYEAEVWIDKMMAEDPEPPIEALRESFTTWMVEQATAMGLSDDVQKAYGLANPPGMSADGLLRYWKKVKNAPTQA